MSLRLETRGKAAELESLIIEMNDPEYAEPLLDEYSIAIWALRFANDPYPDNQIKRLTEIIVKLEKGEHTDDNLNKYVLYTALLSICLKEIKKENK